MNLTVSDLFYLASLPLWLQYIFQVRFELILIVSRWLPVATSSNTLKLLSCQGWSMRTRYWTGIYYLYNYMWPLYIATKNPICPTKQVILIYHSLIFHLSWTLGHGRLLEPFPAVIGRGCFWTVWGGTRTWRKTMRLQEDYAKHATLLPIFFKCFWTKKVMCE